MELRNINDDDESMLSGSMCPVPATPTVITESTGDATSQLSANAAMRGNEDLNDISPPAYENLSTDLDLHQRHFDAQASFTGGGGVGISIDQEARWVSDDKFSTLLGETDALTGPSEGHFLSAIHYTSIMGDNPLSFRPQEYDTENGPSDPISGLALATLDTVGNVLMGVAAGPLEAYRQVKSSNKGSQDDAQDQYALPQALYLAHSTMESSRYNQSMEADRTSSRSSQNPYEQVALSSGKGVVRVIGAGLKSPVTFTHRLAQGFHNAPKLYGDTTVRKTDQITGVKSGLVAAGKGFGYGLYDGLTGFATQPIQGARKEGAVGLLKGFGKGLGGVVFKPAAGACGVPGYAFMGVYKQLQKITKANVSGCIVADRIAQDEADYQRSTEQERLDIVSPWYTAELHRKY